MHISYCTGEAGKEAAAASSARNLLMGGGQQAEDLAPPEGGGGNKGKQRKTEVDVEAEQGKLAEERKRKGRVNEGDDRFSKKSKNEEAAESKKFDVTEDELGTRFPGSVGLVLTRETERYRRERGRMEDPMADYVDSDL